MEGCNKCVQFLRETKGGRGSFIALSDMEKLRERMNRSVQIPEQARRLFDLINPLEERILPAFYNALKDTLVANDFDTAVKIAYVGDKVAWRVVTKDGITFVFVD
jgi:structural maintenance of chromosome 4